MVSKVKFFLKKKLKNNIGIIIYLLIIFLFILLTMCFNSLNSSKMANEIKEFQKNIQQKLESFDPEKKDIKIIFWNSVSNSESEMLNEIIKSFNKKHNKIKVISVNKGNWPELYKNVSGVLPTDNYPNLVFCYPDYLFSYYYSGKLLPFDKFIEYSNQKNENKIKEFNLYQIIEDKVEINQENKTKEEIYSSYWEEGIIKLDGKNEQIFSLPFFKTEELLYYNKNYFAKNKKKFKEALQKFDCNKYKKKEEDWENDWNQKQYEEYFNEKSKEIPKTPFTWEQIEILCETIKNIEKENNEKMVIPFFVQSIENIFYDSAESMKINSSKDNIFNNENIKENILKYFKKNFYDKQYLTSEKLSGLTDNISAFKNQEIYMMINSSRKLNDYQKIIDSSFNLGIAPIPFHQNSTNNSKTLQQGPSICFFYKKNTDEILASWYFIKYLFSEEVSNILLREGKFSPVKQYVQKYLDEHETQKNNDLQYSLLKLINSTNKNKFYTKVFEKSNILRESIGNLFIDCLVINFAKNEDLDIEINKKLKFYENYYNSS
ncbi:ABC transporter substrate-binding protein [Candidatus Phytoplasma pyri]|uniref:ABC transporter substrate-binding protein n=1 Tax=Candidatus Phytoplasma pyri TaxID=47566 RepID=UPI003983BC82